jgi:hypothetical protein
VVGAEDDAVAVEQLVRTAGGVLELADRGVGPRERVDRRGRADQVRGVVEVREVEDEEVEAVPRDEPAADRAGTASPAPVSSDSKRLKKKNRRGP